MTTCPHTGNTWNLSTRVIGRRVLHFEQTDSTNSRAQALADDPLNHGLVLVADEQVAGRGQYGRSWLSPRCSSVLMSVVLFPEGALRRPPLLVAWVAVAVCRLIEQLAGAAALIKWPNDVLVAPLTPGEQAKKICGILIEQQSRARLLATVAGIGLNVTQAEADFTAAGLPAATSLFAATGKRFEAHDVARELIAILDDEYHSLANGGIPALEERWRCHLKILGQTVLAECTGEDVLGTLHTLSFDDVEIEDANGVRQHLRPEVISHLSLVNSH